ncbi:hypothetical protein [Lacticaseibacillus brantae]|uniref:Lipoprotein n=1 Tax=Lacticaseibacillus brantae DSM 23927 TaxID=1423727 RepID=A0A0R2AXE4_9LACO|nr:hypothetical protein [Lacticaseibacillus brantae]KRM72062.1 hypothetical protein FC34_GL001045 [Lacticaseibacillus brantae DSM 23927]
MKKTFTGIIAVFAAVILAGCNNSSNTAVSQSDVTSAIQAKDYGKAEGLNEAILLSKKDDKTAKATDKQLKAMTKAEKAIADYNFDSAKDDLQTAIDTNDGSKTLVSQAKSRQKQVNTYIKQTSTYNKLLDQAKSSYSDKDYTATESTLKELLGDSDINDAAYTPIYKAALELRANNALAQTGTSTSSSSSAASSSSNPAANSPENKPVQGSTTITDADLAQARTDLKSLGQNPEYWSPSDLQRAILKMRAANRTHLNADDIK